MFLAKGGNAEKSRTLILTVIGLAVVFAFLFSIGAPQALAAGINSPQLLTLANGSTVQSLNPLFQWKSGVPKPPRDGSLIEVWKKDKLGNNVYVIQWSVRQQRYMYPMNNYEGVGLQQAKLAFGTQYWWHAAVCTGAFTCGSWSVTWSFRTYQP